MISIKQITNVWNTFDHTTFNQQSTAVAFAQAVIAVAVPVTPEEYADYVSGARLSGLVPMSYAQYCAIAKAVC